jgi:hypothetical protein
LAKGPVTGALLAGDKYYPPLAAAGTVAAQVVRSSPSTGNTAMHTLHMLAFAAARRSIRITNQYLVPERQRRLGWHRRHEGVDDGLDDNGPGRGQGALEGRSTIRGILDGEAGAPAGLSERGEVDRVQLAPVLGVAEEHHLLPLDLSEGVVLHDLPIRVGHLSGDGIGQSCLSGPVQGSSG